MSQHNTTSPDVRRPRRNGKYAKHPACDGCGKPALDYCSDGDTCNDAGNYGLVICDRKRCTARLDGLDIPARVAIYKAQRAENELAESEGRNPKTIR